MRQNYIIGTNVTFRSFVSLRDNIKELNFDFSRALRMSYFIGTSRLNPLSRDCISQPQPAVGALPGSPPEGVTSREILAVVARCP